MSVPDNLHYSEDHEWAKVEGDLIRVGITDYAQHQLGDVVYVELPQKGDSFEFMGAFGVIESVKAASDLYCPIAGTVVDVNTELEDAPELVNEAPYADGWMIVVQPDDPADMDKLMSPADYAAMLEAEE
ncbi:MAG: glycine cleavage system protein GcvH [Anaerolineae bacterium]